MVLHFFNDGIRTTFVTLLPFIAKDLSLNLSSVGFLGSAQPLFGSFLALPAGFFATRLGGFRLLSSLLIIYSLGAFTLSLAGNYPMVVLGVFIGALGFGMFHTISFSLVAKTSDKNNIGKNMGNFTSIGDIGRVAIPPLAVFAVPLLGWRTDFTIIAIIGLLTFLVLRISFSKKIQADSLDQQLAKESHIDFIKQIFNLLKVKKLLLTLSAAILDALASSPVYIFLPFLLFTKGIQITQYGIAASLFLVGSLAGKYILGRLVDKFGNSRVFIISETLMAASLISLVVFTNFYFILILSFLLGVFTRGTTPVVQSMFSQISHKMHYNKIYALSELFIGVSAVITLILMGFIADKIGVVFVFYITAALALLATLPVLLVSKSLSQITSDPGSE